MTLSDLGLSLSPLPRKGGSRVWRTWQWHENRKLDDMFERGCTDMEMAQALGRTLSSIMNQRYQRGLLRQRHHAKRHCRNCGKPCSRNDSTRCRSCHHEAQRTGAVESGSQYFSMRSEQEILPDGTRRTLYGDLRGI